MTELLNLTADFIRAQSGNATYKRAVNYLAQGRASERTLYTNNAITGRWSVGDSGRFFMQIVNSTFGVQVACTCHTMRGRMCDHVATLALAWAREPQTFTRVNEVYDQSHLDDEFDEDEDFDEDDDDDLKAIGVKDWLKNALDKGDPFSLGKRSPAPGGIPVETASIQLSAQPINLSQRFRELYQRLTVQELRGIAQRHNIALSGTKRESVLETLATSMGEQISSILKSLSPQARFVLGLMPFVIIYQDVYLNHLQQALGMTGVKDVNLANALEDLRSAGLITSGISGATSYSYPREISYLLPPDLLFLRPLTDTKNLRIDSPASPFEFALLATRLLFAIKADPELRVRGKAELHPLAAKNTYLQNWRISHHDLDRLANDPNPSKSLYANFYTLLPTLPLLDNASQKTLARTLNTDDSRLDFTLRLLAKLGMVAITPDEPLRVLDEGLAQFMNQPLVARLAPLWNAWLTLKDWSEYDLASAQGSAAHLAQGGASLFNQTQAQLTAQLTAARPMLNILLRRAPTDHWVDFESLVARCRALDTLHALWSIQGNTTQLQTSDHRLNLSNVEDWRTFFAPLLKAALTLVRWFGAAELAYSKDQLVAFRLTELGAYLMRQTDKYESPRLTRTGAAITFTREGQIVMRLDESDPDLLTLLNLLTDSIHSEGDNLIYGVAAEGARRAFEGGWDSDKVIVALEKAAATRLPKALSESLRAWWANFGRVHLYANVALLELADDFALNELLAGTSLAQHLLYRFSPRLIALRPEGVEALRADLVNKGYTPKIAS